MKVFKVVSVVQSSPDTYVSVMVKGFGSLLYKINHETQPHPKMAESGYGISVFKNLNWAQRFAVPLFPSYVILECSALDRIDNPRKLKLSSLETEALFSEAIKGGHSSYFDFPKGTRFYLRVTPIRVVFYMVSGRELINTYRDGY